jgi:hypothetical protein
MPPAPVPALYRVLRAPARATCSPPPLHPNTVPAPCPCLCPASQAARRLGPQAARRLGPQAARRLGPQAARRLGPSTGSLGPGSPQGTGSRPAASAHSPPPRSRSTARSPDEGRRSPRSFTWSKFEYDRYTEYGQLQRRLQKRSSQR